MWKIERTRFVVIVFSAIVWAILWALSSYYNNPFITIIWFGALFLLFPYIDKKFYKMDELDRKISYKAWYQAFMYILITFFIYIFLDATGFLVMQMENAFLLIVISSACIFGLLTLYYSKNPELINK